MRHPLDVVLLCVSACAFAVKIVLVANAESRLECDLRTLGLTERFHTAINSSQVGVAKPSKETFRVALQRAGVVLEASPFLRNTGVLRAKALLPFHRAHAPSARR